MRAWIAASFGLLMLAATGCGDAGKYCAEAMECEEGNDRDEESCIATYDAAEEQASIYGCDEQWTEFSVCRIENSSCVENNGGEKHYTTGDDCQDEYRNLDDCIDGASKLDD